MNRFQPHAPEQALDALANERFAVRL